MCAENDGEWAVKASSLCPSRKRGPDRSRIYPADKGTRKADNLPRLSAFLNVTRALYAASGPLAKRSAQSG